MKQPEIVTTAELGRLLRACRDRRKLSLRDVAEETGISASTLSRCENAAQYGEMDAHSIAVLAGYLDIPIQRINGEQFVYFRREPMPQVIAALLSRDDKLTGEQRNSLSTIFEIAYKELTRATNGSNHRASTGKRRPIARRATASSPTG